MGHSLWGHKVLDTTERLNNNNNNQTESVASSRHVASGALGTASDTCVQEILPDTAKLSPLRPVGVDLIACSREGGTNAKAQVVSRLFWNLQMRLKFRGRWRRALPKSGKIKALKGEQGAGSISKGFLPITTH